MQLPNLNTHLYALPIWARKIVTDNQSRLTENTSALLILARCNHRRDCG